MIERIQAGNTIRLSCTFYDFDGNLVDPDFVKITFYDHQYQKEYEQVLDTKYRSGLGSYFYDYETQYVERRYIYEFYGTIDGLPSIKREDFITVFK